MGRKLAAVLAADIVGYSKLVSEDAASTLSALRDFRANSIHPFADQHRGEIVKSMGDGWLITFASVQDAVSCAIQLQDAIEGHPLIKLRIGIHVGDVTREDEDVFGDGVNVAARLEALAPAGGVTLSDAAFVMLDGTMKPGFADQGEQALKNIERPVRVWLRAPFGAALNTTQSAKPLGFPRLIVRPITATDDRADVQDLAKGLTADIGLYLASIQWLETGNGYTLSHTLRARGDRLRLEARLTDPNGAAMWSGKYDGDLADSFDWQDEVGEAIAAQVYGQILEGERAKSIRIPFDDMTGEQLLFRGLMEFRSLAEDDIRTAMRFGAEAIKRAPLLTQAYAASLSFLLMAQLRRFTWIKSYEAQSARWVKAARPLAPENPVLDLGIGVVDYLQGGAAADLRIKVETAVSRAPNNVEVLIFGGWGYIFTGEGEQALDCFARYRRLGRLCPYWLQGLAGAANASVQVGRHEDAIRFAKLGLERSNDYLSLYMSLASGAGHLRRSADAADAVSDILRLLPDFTLTNYTKTSPYARTKAGQVYLQGLKLAGLPE